MFMTLQDPAPAPPAAPAAPTAQGPATNAPFVFMPATPGSRPVSIEVPRTARDIEALKARREELSNQLQSVDGRRGRLMSQLKQASDPMVIKGLESRIALLDARQLQLESDIQTTGQALTSQAAGLLASSSVPIFGGLRQSQVMTLSVLSIIFVLFPLAVGVARAMMKRSARPGPPPAVFTETAQRLERLEASVDAIAIEIERVSEGQRFVTKLLSEGQPAPSLGAGQRAPETVGGS
jgi:archaellum component FlaC